MIALYMFIPMNMNTFKARILENWLWGLSQELKQLMNLQGYSLKTIKDNTYLYVWRTVGHAKAVWKSLGNIKRIGGMAVIEVLAE